MSRWRGRSPASATNRASGWSGYWRGGGPTHSYQTVVVTHLVTNGSNTDATSYATAAITPTVDRLVLAVVGTSASGVAGALPALSGCGLTWVEVATRVQGVTRLTLFRGLKSSGLSSQAVTIDCDGATQTGCEWSISEFAGVDTSGTDGSGAIAQALGSGGTGQAGSVSLADFLRVANGSFGAFRHTANEAETEGAGFTALGKTNHSAPSASLLSEFKATNDRTVDASWATSTTWAGLAAEIVAGVA